MLCCLRPSFTWRHAVGVHGVLVEVGRVEVGGNLGRDGDVEVAEAEAFPVEAVEPPASRGHVSVRTEQSTWHQETT